MSGDPAAAIEASSPTVPAPAASLVFTGPRVRLRPPWLGRAFWGKGLGQEACRLLLDFAFGSGGFEEVFFRVHRQNLHARRAFERLGARPAGRVSLNSVRTRSMVEHHVYCLTAARWRA